MNSHNALLFEAANRALTTLNDCGFPGVICGGFPLAVQYNQNAKDIDIAVGIQEFSLADLLDMVDVMKTKYSAKAYFTGQIVGRNAKGDDITIGDPRDPSCPASQIKDKNHKVALVIKAGVVDIVFYDVEHDAGVLVAQHDCNLNQFVLAGTTPVFLGLFHPDKHGLRICQEGLHDDRIAYMERKWRAIEGLPEPVIPETEQLPFP